MAGKIRRKKQEMKKEKKKIKTKILKYCEKIQYIMYTMLYGKGHQNNTKKHWNGYNNV